MPEPMTAKRLEWFMAQIPATGGVVVEAELLHDFAAEIERLEADLWEQSAINLRLEAEIERLQARITRDEEHEAAQDDDIIRLMAERDQYKAALEEIIQAVGEQANAPEPDKIAWLAKCLNRLSRIGSIARKAIKGTDGLPTTAELSGSDPDFTGGMESVQYVRMLRGDPHASASGAEGGQG